MDLSGPKHLIHLTAQRRAVKAVCRNLTCRHTQWIDLQLVMDRVGHHHPIVPTLGLAHYSERLRCPKCGALGMFVWPDDPPSRPPDIPNYRIIDNGRSYPYGEFRDLATAENLFVGKGAYIAAAHFYHDHQITFRQGAFVIADSKRDGLPKDMLGEDYRRAQDGERRMSGSLAPPLPRKAE